MRLAETNGFATAGPRTSAPRSRSRIAARSDSSNWRSPSLQARLSSILKSDDRIRSSPSKADSRSPKNDSTASFSPRAVRVIRANRPSFSSSSCSASTVGSSSGSKNQMLGFTCSVVARATQPNTRPRIDQAVARRFRSTRAAIRPKNVSGPSCWDNGLVMIYPRLSLQDNPFKPLKPGRDLLGE